MKMFANASMVSSKAKAVLALSSILILSGTSLAIAKPVSKPIDLASSPHPAPLEDGTYLYGDVSEGNQVGQGYVVFKKQGPSVTGAFYYPQSEFSCFTGTTKNQRLEVLSLGSPYENAIEVEVSLQKMHRIETVDDSKQNSLSMCQQEVAAYQQQQQQIAAPVQQWTTP
mgnify:CR=1 FL=1